MFFVLIAINSFNRNSFAFQSKFFVDNVRFTLGASYAKSRLLSIEHLALSSAIYNVGQCFDRGTQLAVF